MFFFFSKTAGVLFQPLVVISILFLLALLLKKPRWKKILSRSALGLLLFFSNHFIAVTCIGLWEIPAVPFSEVKGPYDYAVLLTGMTRGQVGPPDRVYFSAADRATHTLQLYKLGLVKKVLVSGGSGRLDNAGPREADELAGFLIMAGVKEEDILIENKSRNTHDSAIEVADLLNMRQEMSSRLLLVSSAYHLRRARACFLKAGLHPDLFATDPRGTPENMTPGMYFIPSVEALQIWQILLKEMAGMTTYWLAGYI